MRRQVTKSSGAAGLFVLLGILTILAVTFAAGTYAGRIWANRPRLDAATGEREPKLRGGDVRVPKIVEPTPRLTFYHELTAPLTAPPPPPKPAKSSPPPLTAAHRPATPDAGLAAAATTARFTVQVGAYRLRPPADSLRATLVAAGHDARVVETDAPNGVRFRVQVGDFASREAARDAAARLSGPTFVTTR
jgi:hypothetical protein